MRYRMEDKRASREIQKHWFTIPEAAAYFSLKPKTLFSLAARGLLPEGSVLRLGRAVRVNIKKIEAEAEGKKG